MHEEEHDGVEFTEVNEQPMEWYPCEVCGAEHDVPTCPFADSLPVPPEPSQETR